jgi:SAM-dependent methyltransferase
VGNDAIRDAIRSAYDRVGRCGSQTPAGLPVLTGGELAENLGYDHAALTALPGTVLEAFVGAGALAPQVTGRPGDLVADLGCGAGLDSLLLARRGFRVVSLDASRAMLARLARSREPAVQNPSPVRGALPEIPLASGVARWVLLNGVANLVRNRGLLLAEAHRVLAGEGTLLVADLVAVGEIPDEVRKLPEAWAWCLAGAIEVDEWKRRLAVAGFANSAVDVLEVMDPVARAVIRARRGDVPESGPRAAGGLESERICAERRTGEGSFGTRRPRAPGDDRRARPRT